MRLFIAIVLSEPIREALAQAQAHLKYAGADVKWVAKDNIHLTLKFLGEVPEGKLQQIKDALDEIGKSFTPFEISLAGLGAFPNISSPRVIWVGLDKGAAESADVAARVDEAMEGLGFAKEPRPFAAHLTIGRVRSLKNKEALKEKITGYGLRVTGYETIYSIALFQSTLTPKGPLYTRLHEAKFAGDGQTRS
jgi:2'-5' RNA ligase